MEIQMILFETVLIKSICKELKISITLPIVIINMNVFIKLELKRTRWCVRYIFKKF